MMVLIFFIQFRVFRSSCDGVPALFVVNFGNSEAIYLEDEVEGRYGSTEGPVGCVIIEGLHGAPFWPPTTAPMVLRRCSARGS